MKIVGIETIPVSLPVGKFKDGCDKVGGTSHPKKFCSGRTHKGGKQTNEDETILLSNVIVKIHTDEGITGIGEAACDTTEPVHGVKNMIDRYMAPRLIGQDPMDWEFLIDLVSWDSERGGTRFATSGIDLALYDLVGKIFGVPVYTLIGGFRRDKVLASIEVARNTPEVQVEHCWEYYQQGVRGFKAKIGSNPAQDAESIIGIRKKLGPDISLRADANCGYTVKEAITFCRLVEQSGADLEVLEQPVAKLDLSGMKVVRESTETPIEADESAFSLQMVYNLLQAGAVDLINTKCAKASGIKGVCEWAKVAKAADTSVVIGTEWGSGLKVCAKLHLGAALLNADPVVEFTEIMIHELLLREPLEMEDGYIRVPRTPGLGMELDDDKIEEFRTPDA
ncbi:MAG: mandelate racemase/muconate lactonizing enzyme family protein [Spirochaetales bacterium]|jgi:L-Ala-D/L-Glu epimerase|nr:mandelate racemase/muconate lactonizing enzyme family protein [Spirochaetales bacterium]